MNLPEHPQLKIKLTDILEQYVKKEKLENVPCSNCDKNNTETNGNSYIKSVKFGKVFIHLKLVNQFEWKLIQICIFYLATFMFMSSLGKNSIF